MEYARLLKKSIVSSGYKLNQISELVEERFGIKVTVYYLSRLQNGKTLPASDKLNDALSSILEIDNTKLKAAAYIKKIPADVLSYLSDKTPK